MDLKELLPVLLIAVFAVISAAKKKKRPVSESEEQADTAPSESPWDDLMRELKKGAETDVKPVSDSRPAQPYAVPTAEVLSSYDDEAIEEFENRPVFSYDDLVESGSIESATVAEREVSPTLQPVAADAGAASSEDPFPGGFDPKMAVLYSEILKPRF